MLLELAGYPLPLLGVGGRLFLHCNIRPLAGEFGVNREPFFQTWFGVGLDGIYRAFGLAHPTIDTFIRVNHQHVLPFIKAIDGAYLHAIHVFALDAIFVDDVSHFTVGFIGFLSAAF
jgi:hypothetical protein